MITKEEFDRAGIELIQELNTDKVFLDLCSCHDSSGVGRMFLEMLTVRVGKEAMEKYNKVYDTVRR